MTANDLTQGLLQLFYPRLCEGCRKPLLREEQVLCITCEGELPLTNYHHIADNETVLRFAGRFPFVHATSLAYFTADGLLQYLLHGLKYGNKKENGYFLGKLLGRMVLEQNPEWIRSVDMIVPVPLYISKQQKRGYNQSACIAEGICRSTGINICDSVLIRTRDTDSQTHKTRVERIENVAEAFRVTDAYKLNNKHLLLIDDVLTTGATMEACAQALRTEAQVKISMATIGIAVS